jgi:hypothetical protein
VSPRQPFADCLLNTTKKLTRITSREEAGGGGLDSAFSHEPDQASARAGSTAISMAAV